MLIFGPGIWHYLEYVFFIMGLILQTALLIKHRTTLRKSIIWYLGWIIVPIITLGAYIMIGRALFLHPLPISDEGQPGKNSIDYFSDGKEYFESVFHDLDRAKKSICIECYIIRLDGLSERFVQSLCRKSEEGIEVRVIFDDYGYDAKDFGLVRRLEKSGVECGIFHNMTKCMLTPRKNYRNHRKTIAVDGNICYMGGYNIGDEYLGKGRFGTWEDAAVRITGPQAGDVLKAFSDHWKYCCGEDLSNNRKVFPESYESGEENVQVINGNPIEFGRNPIGYSMTQMIENAYESLIIETPYFIPDKRLSEILLRKIGEGVRVVIIIPEEQDHVGCYWGNRYHAIPFIRKGAEVYCLRSGFLHSKVILCDGMYCSIGTANFDRRSLELNFECSILTDSEEICLKVRKDADRILENCERYTEEMYLSRSISDRVRTGLSAILSGQL